ncbi:MAG TPA: class I SAM-dependent methyltransferase [Candidatus Limnocylindria bacterium]|nr:class I SAM-dependent methyltransferase [Candidatus Limnocylindria bacterium]
MAYIDFISDIHRSTGRDYLARVVEYDKASAAEIAKRFDREYFDGDRKFGYGGYRYDGRWRAFAHTLAGHYGIHAGDRVLDIGCAKGFLLHDLRLEVPEIAIAGVDVSSYAIEHAMDDVRPFLQVANAVALPFADHSFDLVVSVNTLHNLRLPELARALKEIERVGRRAKYIVVDGYRDEREKMNLLYWQLTCETFLTPDAWQWLFDQVGYTGDFACVFFT